MSSSVTIREIADALGITKQAAAARAKKSGWHFEEQPVRGGRQRHFPIDTLPLEVRNAVKTARANAAAQSFAHELQERGKVADLLAERLESAAERRRRKEEGLAKFAALPESSGKRQRAEARRWLVELFYQYHREHGGAAQDARHAVAEQVTAGALEIPAWVAEWLPQYQGLRKLTEASLERWIRTYERDGIWGLVDGYGQRRGQTKVDTNPELYETVLGCMVSVPHITAQDIKDYLEARKPELDIVSVRGLQRFMRRWKADNAQLWTYITNPDRWKSVYMAAYGSHHEQIERLNQIWEMDSTPGDWLLKDGRHAVVGVIDLFSRRLRLVVSRTSTAAAVCSVFRRAVLDWGVPETVRTDNGADYTSRQVESVLHALDVHQQLCIPFASEQKGTIERALQTMSHGILDLLPGFVGHNVAERKVIEARKSFAQRVMTRGETVEVEMTAAELQERLDKWTDHVYMHNAHSGLDGRSPFEVASQWRGSVRRVQDERALDALLAPIAGTRTVSKKGIRLDGHLYISHELPLHTGRQVTLRRDEADIGRVYVYDAEHGEFLCIAECPEITGISLQEAATAAKRFQKRFQAEQHKEYQRFKRHVRENVAEVVLEHRIAESEKITALPHRSESYSTHGLEQAGRAARASEGPEPAQRDARTKADVEALKSEMAQPAPVRSIDRDDGRRKYERWVRLDRRVQAGERLGERDAAFHRSYPQTAEYRSMKGFYEDFGLAVSDD